MTNCKFRETIFCNHNHHYNISRHDILAYVPWERDEGPSWVPPPPPPKKPDPPPIIKRPVPVAEKPKVVIEEKKPEKKKPEPKVPVVVPEKIKAYP